MVESSKSVNLLQESDAVYEIRLGGAGDAVIRWQLRVQVHEFL